MTQQLNVEEVKSRILQYAAIKSELKARTSEKSLRCLHVALCSHITGIKVATQELTDRKNLFQPIDSDFFVEFETYSLDEALKDYSTVDIIHIDTKGATPFVFYGMQTLLTKNPQASIYMIFEYDKLQEAGVAPKEFIYQILRMGFSIAKVDKYQKVSAISEDELLLNAPVNLFLKKVARFESIATEKEINFVSSLIENNSECLLNRA
jgi:hypothetical protein